jgi:hypothetical protein
MELRTTHHFERYFKTLNYLVVYPDKSTKFYKSLRSISSDIYVDYSTISKKLSNSNNCYVTCRLNDYIFYIQKMCFK